MLLSLILIIVIVRHLKKLLLPPEPTPTWNRILITGMVTAIALFFCESAIKHAGQIVDWIGHIMVWSLIALIFYKKEWQAARPVANAVVPLMIIRLAGDIIEIGFPSFYKKWESIVFIATIFGIVWMAAMLMQNRKQRKALEKERLKTAEKEKEIKITEEIKVKLEIQVKERTATLTKQTEELQHALDELKAAQTQLVHSEKMASLGELTAGIAHEIQNPLNFVNNFSELNTELIEEMQQEMDKGNLDDAKAISNDIKENEQKINQHGKRADAIVKGMLQHSQSSSVKKEPTDINKLADEYLRLAYHGLRAKDKSFNATMNTDYDESIGNINIIPQEIGRVILNLINNAFYAVQIKQREASSEGLTTFQKLSTLYEPTVSVSTKKTGNKVLISVKDNGCGIPPKVLDKIFQPFFTTKPTGQGTGLGLSLSYDIIKAHGGELKVETKEGEGAAFIIQLPVA